MPETKECVTALENELEDGEIMDCLPQNLTALQLSNKLRTPPRRYKLPDTRHDFRKNRKGKNSESVAPAGKSNASDVPKSKHKSHSCKTHHSSHSEFRNVGFKSFVKMQPRVKPFLKDFRAEKMAPRFKNERTPSYSRGESFRSSEQPVRTVRLKPKTFNNDKNCRLLQNGFRLKRSPSPHLDINSSYEDLLKQYKSIQSELARLEQEHKPSKKQCIHKQNRRLRSVKVKSPSKTPDVKKVKMSHKKPEKDTKSDATVNTEANTQEKGVHVEDDTELEQLRLTALASCAPKCDTRSNASLPDVDGLDLTTKMSVSSEDLIGVENFEGSSAFSVSEHADNYVVLDMDVSDVSDNDDMLSPSLEQCIEDVDEDDFEIDLLRAELISSLSRTQKTVKKIIKPNLTPPCMNKTESTELGVLNISTRSSNVAAGTVSSVSDIHDKSIARTADVVFQNPESPSAVELPNTMLPRPPSFSPVSVSKREKVCDNKQPAFQLYKRHEFNNPWMFMKQKPVVINLANDSSDDNESSSEFEQESAAMASLEKLIEAEKNKTICEGGNTSEIFGEPRVTECKPDSDVGSSRCIEEEEDAQEKNKARKAAVDAYNLIKKKLALAASTFKKEQQILTMSKIHASKKMAVFITSQLEVQRLREQLNAAERVKITNTKTMFRANVQLRTVQNSISKRALLIKDLKSECEKLETQLFNVFPCEGTGP